ncbi:MAG: hypothetical protein IKB36_00345 [Clostridia bacterium]|nr:hypothetical protein [Clostridia bacterium]
MAKKELSPRRLKGYYKFSKKYPSRNAESYAIGESRKMKKKEKARKIVFAVLLCCLFVATFILVSVSMTLSNRPLANNIENETLISVDNLGTIRATYIENTVLGEISDLSKELKKAKKNGCNAVMLDFKTQEGYVTIDGTSDKYYSIDNVIIEKIKSEGFIIIARIFCFEDSFAPQRLGAFVYENQEKTKIWFDAPAINGGRVWLDPTSARATNYLCTIIEASVNMGADCIYLQSVEFPQAREGAPVFFSQDSATLNRNLVLMQFIEQAVKEAGKCPVIIGVPLEGADGGNQEKWGGTLFDTAASICSPVLLPQENSDYVEYIENNYTVMNDRAKNNFSTIKIVPTVKNQSEDVSFYEKLSESTAESYIIVP